MKPKALLITYLLFFMLVNTLHFWGTHLGILFIPALTILFIFFIYLLVLFLFQLWEATVEKFRNKQRFSLLILMLFVLVSTFFRPFGLIDFENRGSKDVLVAQREGAANCMTTIKLRENKTFIQRIICFGREEQRGTYSMKADTIFFYPIPSRDSFYKFALVSKSEIPGMEHISSLILYKHNHDSSGFLLSIIKNDIN